MPTPEQIRRRFEEMAKNAGPAVSNIAKVKTVDEEKGLCVLVDEDGQEILNVRLRPVLSNKKSFMLVPKVGSYVLAVRVEDDDDWMVIAADEIEKIGYYIDNTILELTDKVHVEAGGESLANLIDDLFTAIGNMVFTTNAGPTIKLVNKPEFEALKTKFKKLLK
ncbi:hypothetical protein [Flavobacterium sp.]|uniref:hypothetical protein n=1 Tax=Flavobacterium sp. TaxID=239 RepID=UPI002602E47B|nr:hypothetical protein [Flavobacterium sp.]